MPEQNLTEIFKHVGIAAVGGVAKYLNEYIKGSPFNWKICAAKFIVCGFIGFVFAQFFTVYKTEYAYVASALAGYAGTEIFDTAVHALARATGKRILGVEITFPPLKPGNRRKRQTRERKENANNENS
jgi:hypothetical protein